MAVDARWLVVKGVVSVGIELAIPFVAEQPYGVGTVRHVVVAEALARSVSP